MAAAGAAALALAPGRALAAAPRPMAAKPIGRSREELPVIGLGTWQTFDVGAGEAARAPLRAVLAEFAALGGRLIDSSPMYGRAEQVAGDLITQNALRDALFIATKVWTRGRAEGIAQMQDSMRKLRADPIDLMQVHNLVDLDTQLSTLADWKKAARVRHIGITHSLHLGRLCRRGARAGEARRRFFADQLLGGRTRGQGAPAADGARAPHCGDRQPALCGR
jgi:hypothetical protein